MKSRTAKVKRVVAKMDWIGLKAGDVFTKLKTVFYNGEHHYVLLNSEGDKVEFPSIFFEDFND